jgi:hypothetical protein
VHSVKLRSLRIYHRLASDDAECFGRGDDAVGPNTGTGFDNTHINITSADRDVLLTVAIRRSQNAIEMYWTSTSAFDLSLLGNVVGRPLVSPSETNSPAPPITVGCFCWA